MVDQSICITDYDLRRLSKLVLDGRYRGGQTGGTLRKLWTELGRADVVPSKNVPPDVITMNSTVRLLDVDRGTTSTFTLVFPAAADIATGCISILSPIGMAMLGYRVGDSFEWEVPSGIRRLQVESIVYQPEAAGDYHL